MYLNCLSKKRDMVNTFISKKTFILGKDECACVNFGKSHTQQRTCVRACAIGILAKCTRACDVRAVENQVCECACVGGKKSSQLTVLVIVILTQIMINVVKDLKILRNMSCLEFFLRMYFCESGKRYLIW